MHRVPFRLALAATTVLGLSGPVFALDGNAFLAQINKTFAASGATFSADTVSVQGADITMTGATFKPPGVDAKPIRMNQLSFTGVEEDEEQNYTADKVTFPDVNLTEGMSTLTARDLSLSGVFLAANPDDVTLDSLAPIENFHSGPIVVTKDGKEVFSIGGMDINSTVRDDESGIDSDLLVNNMKIDLPDSPDPKAKEAIEKLGIQTIEGTITGKSFWETDKGTTKIDTLSLDFKNVGKLDISLGFSGLTIDLLKQVKVMGAQMNDPAKKDAAGLQMMGFLQQLTFDSARVRFEDASITRRALDYAGSQQGVSGDQLAQSLKAMAPLMIGQLNLPDLQASVTAAATTFLDDPKSLTVTAAPSAPVAFPVIMGAAMGAPKTLPTVLGVKVSAND